MDHHRVVRLERHHRALELTPIPTAVLHTLPLRPRRKATTARVAPYHRNFSSPPRRVILIEMGSDATSTLKPATPAAALRCPRVGAHLDVLDPGLLTTVQDAWGRRAAARYGVSACGALDPFAAELANALVGNPPDAAVLEITLAGPTLRLGITTAIALVGAHLGGTLDGEPLLPGWSVLARAGSTLAFGDRQTGARAYLAISGGILVPTVLGSAATDLRAGFGGHQGRPLRAGDRLPLGVATNPAAWAGRHIPPTSSSHGVRVLPGPHLHRFAPDAMQQLHHTAWRVSGQADRMGYRLDGPPLPRAGPADVASLGLPVGAIQVPGDGRPIVLLADHQPTGGYTVLANAIRADLPLLAQLLPGDEVRFTPTTLEQARAAFAAHRQRLAALLRPGAAQHALGLAGALPIVDLSSTPA